MVGGDKTVSYFHCVNLFSRLITTKLKLKIILVNLPVLSGLKSECFAELIGIINKMKRDLLI